MAGRPRAEINVAVVTEMRALGFNWVMIAAHIGVHIDTLLKWRSREKFDGGEDDPLEEVTDEELDEIMTAFMDGQEQRGERLFRGHLLELGVRCTVERLRASVGRINEPARKARGQRKHKRVDYDVHEPHHLWHHDGWHKLSKLCGIVVHGCVDGATRLAIYARATDNNRADTVLSIFMHATGPSSRVNLLPSRLRGDRGGENRRVAEYMFDKRGLGRGSYLTGASWQNQRIESYWRFLNSQCLGYYRELIKDMVKARQFSSADEGDRWVFQYLFLPLINHDLDVYIKAWDHHPIRTERSLSPRRLEYLLKKDFPPPVQVDLERYGVEGVEEDEQDEDNQVQVFPAHCALNDFKRALFAHHVQPFGASLPKSEHVPRFVINLQYYYDLLEEQERQERQEQEQQEQAEAEAEGGENG